RAADAVPGAAPTPASGGSPRAESAGGALRSIPAPRRRAGCAARRRARPGDGSSPLDPTSISGPMTVGHAIWPDQLTDDERACLRPGMPEQLDRSPRVLIVGGGMLGLATAAACVRAGPGSVVVIERDWLGADASGGAAGLLMAEAHDGVDRPALVDLARPSLDAWPVRDERW